MLQVNIHFQVDIRRNKCCWVKNYFAPNGLIIPENKLKYSIKKECFLSIPLNGWGHLRNVELISFLTFPLFGMLVELYYYSCYGRANSKRNFLFTQFICMLCFIFVVIFLTSLLLQRLIFYLECSKNLIISWN